MATHTGCTVAMMITDDSTPEGSHPNQHQNLSTSPRRQYGPESVVSAIRSASLNVLSTLVETRVSPVACQGQVGRKETHASMSFENLFKILPSGEVSKKLMGALKTPVIAVEWRDLDALNPRVT